MIEQKPRVGVGVWIRKDGKVLLGKRRRGFDANTWCPPGGGVDLFETIKEAAIRETSEETALTIKNPLFIAVVDDIVKHKNNHWVTLYFVADWKSGRPRDAENEIGSWTWYDWKKLPSPLFIPTRNFVKSGYNPFTV